MTAPVGRPARGRRPPSWPQWSGALVAVAASLAALSLPGGPARAATTTSYDQMTGVGPTASAVNVPWTAGILDSNNTADPTANTDRTSASPTSPDWFMYKDFKNLAVTVSQTEDLGHQGITVSWTGGQPTDYAGGVVQDNFLQMMECWGDATTGPTPEQCEYGSAGLLPSSQDARIGEREGDLCAAGAVPSTSTPPASANGDGVSYGCDPEEPGSSSDQIAPCPGTYCAAGTFNVPFSPVSDPTGFDYAGATDTTWYSEFNTDEVQLAVTNGQGEGQQQFETLTGVQAPGLGCGQAESDNTPRGCWLVIVPRGTYEPNGYQIKLGNGNSFINTSPLSAANWAQRIQIHLAFAPVGSFCAPGTLERQTYGSQIVARAMQSWQLALNQSANCSRIYGYSAVTEATSTLNIQAGGDSGLAFTTIPIGSEATRDGESAPTNLPTILYAPVAIAALDFGFNINMGSGYITTPVKLTPVLVAKALTQSYKQDLPDYYPGGDAFNAGNPGPAWASTSPLNISEDPTFQSLNTTNGVAAIPANPTGPIAPLLTEDHTAPNQQVWQWIQSSSAATTWLGGTPDASDGNMVIDPDYKALNLGQAPAIDSFPRAYGPLGNPADGGVLNLCEPADASPSPSPSPSASPSPSPSPTSSPPCPAGQRQVQKHSLDLLPYTDNYDSASAAVLSANNSSARLWDGQATAPDGSLGWWDKAGIEDFGEIWMWAADDTPDLAAYGLIPAQLCNDAGTTCISPDTAAVTAAVTNATADSAGLLQVNPANPGSGAYPLTQIVYAAVPTNQSAAALTDYASLISYAVGNGQAPGAAAGDLPPGYLPLPSTLVTQAQSVVTQLQTLATASPSPSTSSSSSSSSTSQSSSSSSAAAQDTGALVTSGTTAASNTSATPSPTPAATPAPTPAATPTQAQAATSSLAKIPVTSSSSYRAVALSSPTTPGGPVISLPQAQVAAGTTPQQAVGAFRYVLISVAILGAGFFGIGAVLRSGGLAIFRRRRLQ